MLTFLILSNRQGTSTITTGGTMEGFLLWMILGAIEVAIFVMLAIAVIMKNPGKPMGKKVGVGLVLMVFCAFGGIGYMLYLLLKAEPAQQPPVATP